MQGEKVSLLISFPRKWKLVVSWKGLGPHNGVSRLKVGGVSCSDFFTNLFASILFMNIVIITILFWINDPQVWMVKAYTYIYYKRINILRLWISRHTYNVGNKRVRIIANILHDYPHWQFFFQLSRAQVYYFDQKLWIKFATYYWERQRERERLFVCLNWILCKKVCVHVGHKPAKCTSWRAPFFSPHDKKDYQSRATIAIGVVDGVVVFSQIIPSFVKFTHKYIRTYACWQRRKKNIDHVWLSNKPALAVDYDTL